MFSTPPSAYTQSALAIAEAEFKCISESLAFYKDVSPDKELRDTSIAVDERSRKFANEESMREDLYKSMATAEANLHKMGGWEELTDEQKRLVEKMLLDGKRAGLALEKREDRERLKVLKDQLSDACSKFRVGDCALLRVGDANVYITEKLQRGKCESTLRSEIWME